MDERKRLLLTLFLVVGAVAAALWVIGWRNQAPPGQKGLKGTGLERSRALFLLQMGLLAVLLVACLLAALALVPY